MRIVYLDMDDKPPLSGSTFAEEITPDDLDWVSKSIKRKGRAR